MKYGWFTELPIHAFKHYGDRRIKPQGGGNPFEAIGDVFEDIGDAVGDVIDGAANIVGDAIESVAETVESTIEGALDNPVSFAAKAAAIATGQYYLLPYIGAAETLEAGGDIGDALKNAAISYAAGQVGAGAANAAGSNIAGSAAAGATGAALSGGDPIKGALSSALNTGFNQALDAAATAINTPSPNTSDLSFKLPEFIKTGLGTLSDDLTEDAVLSGNYDMEPVDYSLRAPKSNIPTSQPGFNPAGSYLGLSMDSIQGQAPGLASMGGGSGLSIDARAPLGDPTSFINLPNYSAGRPQGTISSAGFIDESAMPALGDPTSFINNPKVTGQPVIPTPACAYNVNMPNVNISDLLNQREARQNRALCLAFGGFDMSIPWLNTRAQLLNARPANVGCASTANAGARPGELNHIYDQITPELGSVFADRGIGMSQSPQFVGQVPSAGISAGPSAGLGFNPLNFSSGGSAETTCSTWGAMSKFMPKFYAANAPSMLQTMRTQRQAPSLSQLKQMYDSVSQRGNIGGMARGGLPSKYQEAAPEGHKPEFVTGLTGYYAGGRGTGQSDDIPAMLHDGDYVIDAEAVSALGDGSSKAGKDALTGFMRQVPHRDGAEGKPVPAQIADGEFVLPASFVTALGGGDNKRGAQMLDTMRERLRAHKRSAPTSKIPPKALSPLDYLKKAK